MSTIEMITIRELLRDPQYREFFTKVPKLPDHYTEENQPWKLYIHKPGEAVWRSKKFGTYSEAFAGFKKMLPNIDNAAINCRPLSFAPPSRRVRLKGQTDSRGKQVIKTIIWQPRITPGMEAHNWCPHCRRPTVFRVAVVNLRARGGYQGASGGPSLRCSICGASERIVDLRHPERAQQWDTGRVGGK